MLSRAEVLSILESGGPMSATEVTEQAEKPMFVIPFFLYLFPPLWILARGVQAISGLVTAPKNTDTYTVLYDLKDEGVVIRTTEPSGRGERWHIA